MDYGQIISQSWNLLWKHKILWAFGFLAALGGGGGNFNINGTFRGPMNFPEQDVSSPELRKLVENLVRWLERGEYSEAMNIFSVITGFLIVLSIVIWLVSVIARAGLVTAVQVDYNSEPFSWRPLFATGTSKLWQLVGLKITLFGIPGLLFFLVIVTSLSAIYLSIMKGFATGQLDPPSALFAAYPVLIGFICIGIPLSLALYLVLYIVDGYAFRGIVMDDMKVFQSIKHGWHVGMDNLGPTIILGLIFTVIRYAVVAVILIPVVGIIALIYDNVDLTAIVVTMLSSILIGAAINAVFVSMQSIAYSKAYLEFMGRKSALVDSVPG